MTCSLATLFSYLHDHLFPVQLDAHGDRVRQEAKLVHRTVVDAQLQRFPVYLGGSSKQNRMNNTKTNGNGVLGTDASVSSLTGNIHQLDSSTSGSHPGFQCYLLRVALKVHVEARRGARRHHLRRRPGPR